MEINFDTGLILRNSEAAPPSRAQSASADSVVLSTTTGLRRSLGKEPAIRLAEVARARELFSSSGYPPDTLINSISNLLARQWPSSDFPE